jgi:hypothetical protein
MKFECNKYYAILIVLNVLFITKALAGTDEMINEISMSCSSLEAGKKTLLQLPEKLQEIRVGTEEREKEFSLEIQNKINANKLSEMEVANFFYGLELNEKYKKFESERVSLFKPYMDASEQTVRAAVNGDYVSACKSGIVMKFVGVELNKLMIDQWQYIFSEMEITRGRKAY